MKKHLAKVLSVFLIFLFLMSCKNQLLDNNLKIYGYALGDSLTNEFEITERYGEYFEIAELINDRKVIVSTTKSHIIVFTITLTSEKQFKEVKQKLENHFNSELIHLVGETKTGLKLNGEEFYFTDSTCMTEYSLLRKFGSDTCRFAIFNEKISDSISILFIPDFEKPEVIEFIE